MQIFFASIAYLFVYDLEALPKDIGRYFFPVSLERARSVMSAFYVSKGRNDRIDNYSCEEVNKIAESLSSLLVKTAKYYQNKEVEYGEEKVVNFIYKRCINNAISQKKILF
jgi:hypothetical protein